MSRRPSPRTVTTRETAPATEPERLLAAIRAVVEDERSQYLPSAALTHIQLILNGHLMEKPDAAT